MACPGTDRHSASLGSRFGFREHSIITKYKNMYMFDIRRKNVRVGDRGLFHSNLTLASHLLLRDRRNKPLERSRTSAFQSR